MAGDPRTYDVFISHAWRYHDDWNRLGEVLNTVSGFRWRNFSVPWYDPALDPNTELGSRLVGQWLESQIIPADTVFFLDSVYAVKSARKWLDRELAVARAHGKPVFALPTFGETGVSDIVARLADAVLPWDAKVLVWAIRDGARRREAA